ncbi:MAG: hypothetical protein ACREBG_21390 [Pyrinomonadaceae bacterium]
MSKLSFEIQFRSANDLSTSIPVEVRRPNLTLAATTLASDIIELEPGQYYVTARLPAGQELFDYVEVMEGRENKAVLESDPEQESPHEWQASQHYLVAQRQRSVRGLESSLESLGGESVEAKLRSIAGNVLNEDYVITEPTKWEFSYSDELAESTIHGTNKIQFVQLCQTNAPALNMALPAYSDLSCKLVVTRQPDGLFSFDAHLWKSMVDMLLRFSNKGYQEQASLTSKALDAELMLYDKGTDPIAAAVGAYAILRFNMLESLHEWTENLRNRFQWLPDGAAIRGEHLTRRGKHKEALAAFLELSKRGLPLFSDGLTYAVDRLRLYTNLKETFTEEGQLDQARTLLQRLQRFADCADFREPFTTFTGLIPHEPDSNPLEEVVTIDNGLDLAQIFK